MDHFYLFQNGTIFLHHDFTKLYKNEYTIYTIDSIEHLVALRHAVERGVDVLEPMFELRFF